LSGSPYSVTVLRRVAGIAVATGLVTGLVAGCTSSATPKASPLPGSTTAPSSTPVSTSASPSPSPTPLSPYEADPAVQALRAWAAQAARTVNSGKYDDAALDALMTPQLAKTMKHVLGTEVGHRYPGPIPFTPVRVTVVNASNRDVRLCVVSDGFSINPKTGKPFAKFHVAPIDAGAVSSGGKWLVAKFDVGSFSCSGVRVKEVRW
jgi:hypothetical protein